MLIGHQKQWKFLKKITEIGKISHAYLFTGQEKLGKKKIALEWVSLFFNESNDIEKKYYPDLLLVEPDTQASAKREGERSSSPAQASAKREGERSSSPGKEIKISQIRELIQKLSLKCYFAPISASERSVAGKCEAFPEKIAIIDKAHLMNQEAQNALLKTLEEPKGKTLLILITEFPEALFPTILSRVQVIKFYPVKEQEIKEYLRKQGINDTEVEEITELSFGKPGLVIDFISNPEKLKNEKKIRKELIEISNSNLAFRFQYVKKLSEGENIGEILNIWLRYFRETDIYKFKNIIKQIQEINFLLSRTNVNPKTALEVLMLEL